MELRSIQETTLEIYIYSLCFANMSRRAENEVAINCLHNKIATTVQRIAIHSACDTNTHCTKGQIKR